MRWRLPIVAAIQIETTLLYRHDLGMYLRDDMIKVCSRGFGAYTHGDGDLI